MLSPEIIHSAIRSTLPEDISLAKLYKLPTAGGTVEAARNNSRIKPFSLFQPSATGAFFVSALWFIEL